MRARGTFLERAILAGVLALGCVGCGTLGADDAGGRSGVSSGAAAADKPAKPPASKPPSSPEADGDSGDSLGPAKVMGASKTFAVVPRGNESDAKARLVGLDATTGSGIETVTFTFADTKVLPKYRVKYVDALRANPEDEPVPLSGNAFLEVGFVLTNPNTNGRLAVPPDLAPDQPQVKELLLVRNLGGSLAFGVGLERRAAFRVREFDNPTRLVVEVRTQ